jgi:hypothetical protein
MSKKALSRVPIALKMATIIVGEVVDVRESSTSSMATSSMATSSAAIVSPSSAAIISVPRYTRPKTICYLKSVSDFGTVPRYFHSFWRAVASNNHDEMRNIVEKMPRVWKERFTMFSCIRVEKPEIMYGHRFENQYVSLMDLFSTQTTHHDCVGEGKQLTTKETHRLLFDLGMFRRIDQIPLAIFYLVQQTFALEEKEIALEFIESYFNPSEVHNYIKNAEFVLRMETVFLGMM